LTVGWRAVTRLGFRVPIVAAALSAALAVAGDEAAGNASTRVRDAQREDNPCRGPERAQLRCPDLQMRPPYDIHVERTPGGRVLLHATNAIKSRGRGPIELRGRRTGRREMRVRQHIYRVGGPAINVRTRGELYFYFIPGQGRYWKFASAARFEIWSLDRRGLRKRLVRTGPKLHYCFRDFERTDPSPRTPRVRVYPGCNQNSRKRAVTLGTSVGWSDIYPSTYHENWIDVTGLRGCFAFVHRADPRNHIYESHEGNNDAQRVVRLPWERGPGRCP
jgi:hypothetical protein